MKNKKFFDIGQASGYLRHTIIRVAKEPVYVYDVIPGVRSGPDKFRLNYVPLSEVGEEAKTITLVDEDVDMNPVPLGFCMLYNGESYHTYYVARTPARRWKIGLALENIQVYNMAGGPATPATVATIFPTRALIKTIQGKYMDVDKAKVAIRGGRGGTIPISRQFAISSDYEIYFKTSRYPIGRFTGNGPVLKDEYFYMKEALEEDIARP